MRLNQLLIIGTCLASSFWIGCNQADQPTPAETDQATAAAPSTDPNRSSEPMTATEGNAEASSDIATEPFVARLAADDLRVFNYNVNSVFPNEELLEEKPIMSDKFARLLKATKPDIVTLQELPGDLSNDKIVALMNEILPVEGGTWYAYKGEGGFMDNAIVSRFPISQTGWKTTPAATDGRPPRVVYGLVDLPDNQFETDAYFIVVHFKCCGGTDNDPIRQAEIDAVMGWIRDAKTPGDHVDIPEDTAILITGDLNTVGGPGILQTATLGNISDEDRFGADFLPDWDDTDLVDTKPQHNMASEDIYTWRDDTSRFDPGRLDYIIYSDSVLNAVKKYILNTTTMSEELLAANGLQRFDVNEDDAGAEFDHLPLIVDFRPLAN